MQNLDETKSTRPQKDGESPQNDPPEQEEQAAETKQTEVIEEIARDTDDQEKDTPDPSEKKPRRHIGRIIALGLVSILILAGLGALGGYLRAVDDRVDNQEAIISTEVADQFLLGLINFERGEYEFARQRFEYILQIDPNNQAAKDKLTETILLMGASDTLPTARPTSTIGVTPTPDTRALDDIYNQVLALLEQKNWDVLLETLDSLRIRDPEYKAVELDGLYYLAYRNRGIYRIQILGNLEGGIFDLNRAELYGPLDIEARNYRDWAGKYITGVSFWGINWDEVLNYLSPLVVSAPYLRDSNGFTAQDRVATAQVEANAELVETARYRFSVRRYCEAYDLYREASAYIQLSQDDLENYQESEDQCFGVDEPTQTPEEPTATATPEP